MSFKMTKFKVTYQDLDGLIKTEVVSELHFNQMGAFKALTVSGKMMTIDYQRVYLREFTTKFDKLGQELYFGDIAKMEKDGVEVHWSIGIADGIPALICDQIETYLPLTENNVTKCEKVGDIYSNENLILAPIPEEMFKKMSESTHITETEI